MSLKKMSLVLLIGQDWKMRALLRAELLEEGIEVRAYATVASAFEDQEDQPFPQLIFADVSTSDNPKAELGQLEKWSARGPTWVLASHSVTKETDLEGRGFERVIFRPLNLGELVGAIQRRLKESGGNR